MKETDNLSSTISGILAMKAFRKQFSTGYRDANHKLDISPAQSSQIVSILSAGTFFGSLLAAPLGDKLGRRLSLIIAVGIFSFGVVLQTCAMHIPLLISGRYEILFPTTLGTQS
jgi:MFS family permease